MVPHDLERESYGKGQTKKSCGEDYFVPFNTEDNFVSQEALQEKLNGGSLKLSSQPMPEETKEMTVEAKAMPTEEVSSQPMPSADGIIPPELTNKFYDLLSKWFANQIKTGKFKKG